MTIDEKYRLHNFHSGESPSGLSITLTFRCPNKDACIAKIISVMELIVQYNHHNWPDDEHWQDVLPQWLLATFREYSDDELTDILANKSSWADLDWTFGSWLDRMREREWSWWSLERTDEAITLHLQVDGFPASIKSLEHLIVATKATIL